MTEKAQSPQAWLNSNANVPEQSGVNPYESASDFESHTGTAGGQPGANLKIRGSKSA